MDTVDIVAWYDKMVICRMANIKWFSVCFFNSKSINMGMGQLALFLYRKGENMTDYNYGNSITEIPYATSATPQDVRVICKTITQWQGIIYISVQIISVNGMIKTVEVK